VDLNLPDGQDQAGTKGKEEDRWENRVSRKKRGIAAVILGMPQ